MRALRPLGLLLTTLALVSLMGGVAEGHRNGCHRWHSCPSDTGSYVCGDLGYSRFCPSGAVRPPAVAGPLPEYARTPEIAFVSQTPYPRIVVGQSTTLTLTVKRLHGPSWANKDVKLLVSDPDVAGRGLRGWDGDGLIAFNTGSPLWSDTQTFSLAVQALAPGVHRLQISFFHKTFGSFGPRGIYWDVAVDSLPSVVQLYEGWHSRWVAQSDYPTLRPGEIGQFWIRFANVGTESWTRGTWGRQANLALNHDDKSASRLGMSVNWLWDDRIATTTLAIVAPGDIGEFRFSVRAPATPGTHVFNLRPVIDGLTWLEDEGVFWTITVR